MRRRTLILRAAPAALGAACAGGAPPSRRPRSIRLLAPHSAALEGKLEAWRMGAAEASGAPVVVSPVPGTPEAVPAPPHPDQVEAALAADPDAGDLLWLDQIDVPLLALRRRLRPLHGLLQRDRYDLKRFMPHALQPGYGFDGQLYTLPEETDARQVYFHRRHFLDAGIDFRRAGFDFERPAITWEALRRAALDLAAAPQARSRLPFDPRHHGAPLEQWGWQNGGEWLTPDGRRATFRRPENVEALAWLVAQAQELGGARRLRATGPFPPPARAGTAADLGEGHPFAGGRVSICIESTRFVSSLLHRQPEFPLGYVQVPRRRDGWPLVSASRTWAYGLLRGAPDEAWDVLRFLLSPEAALAGAQATARREVAAGHVAAGQEAGGLIEGRVLWYPPFSGQLVIDRRLAALYRTGSKLFDEARDHGLEQLRHTRYPPRCPAPHDVWPLLAQARQDAILGSQSPAEVLAAAERAAQARLDAAWAAVGKSR